MSEAAYQHISEIVGVDTGAPHPPDDDWEIEILERGLSENLGDLGGREDFVANARVRVKEPDGTTWEGLTIIEE